MTSVNPVATFEVSAGPPNAGSGSDPEISLSVAGGVAQMTRLIEIDEMPTTNGRNVEFTIRVSEKPLEMDETARVIEGLRDTWQQSSNHPSEESFVGHDEDYQVDAD